MPLLPRKQNYWLVAPGLLAPLLAVAALDCVGDDPSNDVTDTSDTGAADQLASDSGPAANDSGADAASCSADCDGAKCFEGVCGGNEIVQISGGDGNACALTKSGSVYCWGRNDTKQLGTGGTDSSCSDFGTTRPCQPTPVRVAGLDGIKQISAGYESSCAVRASDNAVLCWGSNTTGQLGHDPGSQGDGVCASACNGAPTVVAGLTDATEVHVGAGTACVITSAGKVKCWGSNQGELGQGSATVPSMSSSPLEVPGVSNVSQLAVSSNIVCALTMPSGEAYCWGWNVYGGLGHTTGTMGDDANNINGTPHLVYAANQTTALTGFTAVGVKNVNTCFVSATQVYCDGAQYISQVVNGTPTPTAITGVTPATAVDANYSACAILSNNNLTCWGTNGNGDLGQGNIATVDAGLSAVFPPAVVAGVSASQISILNEGALVLTTDHQVLAWGTNTMGTLGHVPGTNGDVDCYGGGVKQGQTGKCNATPSPVLGLP